jgi:hypothetical protein
LGGSKTNEATKFILRKLFTDKLAMTYSWCGGKGKRVMSSLAVSRVIIGNNNLKNAIIFIINYINNNNLFKKL